MRFDPREAGGALTGPGPARWRWADKDGDGALANTIPANVNTPAWVSSPGSVSGTIDFVGDHDWYRTTLEAGVTYTFSLNNAGGAAGLSDPYLVLYNSAGASISADDDSGPGLDAQIIFTPSIGGDYFVGASGLPNFTGNYTIVVTSVIDLIRGDPATNRTLDINGASASSVIDSAGDEDWFRITLTAGESYAFTLNGVDGFDPMLRIYGTNNLIAIDDDGGPGSNSMMQFTAPYSGTYYLSAGGYGSETGEYTISAATGPAQNPLDTLDLEFTFGATNINVYFATAGQDIGPLDAAVRNWTSAEIASVMSALQTIADTTNLTFTQVGTSAGAHFIMALTDLDDNVLGITYPNPSQAHLAFAPDAVGWSPVGLQPGGLGYSVIIHEVGHALGLDHPHMDGLDVQVMQGVTDMFGSYGTFELNQGVFTIMSYNDGWPLGPDGVAPTYAFGYSATPMALDIAFLQALYGADITHNAGATTYTLSDTNQVYAAIWDAGGIDTIVYSGAREAHITLASATLLNQIGGGGVVSYVADIFGGFTIANGVVIENATGGSGNDTLTGNAGANVLNGSSGSDTLLGLGGGDTLLGGDGSDRMTALPGDTIDGGAGSDFVLINLSASVTALHYDVSQAMSAGGFTIGGSLIRNTEKFELQTGAGDDTLFAGLIDGPSYWFAGAGFDTLTIDFSAQSASSGLNSQSFYITGGGRLEFQGVEAFDATGGSGDDGYVGGAYADYLRGNGGNDTLSGNGGADWLDGGDGADRLNGGDGDDELIGNDGNDDLRGNAGADILRGGDGDDRLSGGDGTPIPAADWIDGGAGRDGFTLYFGGGSTQLVFNAATIASASGYTFATGAHVRNVEYFDVSSGTGDDQVFADHTHYGSVWQAGGGADRLTLDLSAVAAAITITYGVADPIGSSGLRTDVFWGGVGIISRNVEALTITGGAGNDSLVGHNARDIFSGGAGDDVLSGAGGNDELVGGAGVDRFDGGDGDDIIVADADDDFAYILGGAGNDLFVFTSGSAPAAFDLSAAGFESAQAWLTDTGGAAWAEQTDYYDTQWRLLRSHIVNDDATSVEIYFDVTDSLDWESNWNHYAASGGRDINTVTYDDGSSDVLFLDPDNAVNWTTNWNRYDALGERTINTVTYDDGITEVVHFDPQDTLNWTTNWRQIDVLDRTLINTVTYDDGVSEVVYHDIAGTQNWTTNWNQYAAGGQLAINSINFDNGTSVTLHYDYANVQTWSSNWNRYDTLGRLDVNSLTFDNGRYSVVDYDQANAHAWATIWSLYDSGGNLLATQTTNDDGSVYP